MQLNSYNLLKQKKFFFLSIILIFILAIYYNTIKFDFVTDDYDQIVFDKKIKSIFNIFDFFLSPISNSLSTQYYRPIFTLSLSVDYFMWGLNPIGYHLSNIILYCLFIICCFVFVNIFIDNTLICFIITLLFSVHPVHSEAVSWISARNEILMSIFFLLSFIFFIKFSVRKSYIFLTLSYIFFLIAIFSKETAVVLPIILYIYDNLFNFNTKKKEKILIITPFIVLLIFYIILRINLLDSPFGDNIPISKKLYSFFLIGKEYLKLIIFPKNLKVIYYDIIPQSIVFNLNFLFSIIVFISQILIIFFAAKTDKREAFFLIFYCVILLPYSGLVTIIRVSPIADRYLFLPSLGLITFIVLFLLRKNYNFLSFKYLIITSLVISIILSIITVRKNKDYENNFSYLLKMIEHAPNYYEGYNGLGVEFLNKGDYNSAEFYFLKAIELSVPNTYRVYLNLGTLYTKMNNIEEAKKSFYKVVKNEKNIKLKAYAYYNLSIIYYKQGDINYAEELIKRAIELDSKNANFFNNLGVIYFLKGNKDEAKKMFIMALSIDPDHEDARKNYNLLK